MAQILIVDDEEKIRVLLKIMLVAAGHQVYQAENGHVALELLLKQPVDMVITDMRMDEMGGMELLAAIREKQLGCPVVFVTAFASMDSVVDALRLGAADYLIKPFEERDVLLAVERTLGMRRLLVENIRLKQQYMTAENFTGVFVSPPMLKVRDLSLKVAASSATVLLTGESGTGKEVIARFIHHVAKKDHEPFIALNCAAIAPNLIEAELFGYEKGAFTGADKKHLGKFEFAADGTLFLDEIGELPLEAQAKLLRAIQEKSIQRVGGNQELPIHCRLICATNRNLAQQVQKGIFREDLFYRLAVFPIPLPPLRERKQDIVPLVSYCVDKLGGRHGIGDILTPAAQQLLQQHTWPGNVRELFNVIERAMIMKGGKLPFSSDDFPRLGWHEAALQSSLGNLFKIPPTGIDYEELQRSIVRQSLQMTQGNQSAAARLLRVSRARYRTMLAMLESDQNIESVEIRLREKRKK